MKIALKKIIKSITIGLIYSALLIILILTIQFFINTISFPILKEISPLFYFNLRNYIPYVVLFLFLSTASEILEGTVYSFIVKAISKIIVLMIIFTSFNNGFISYSITQGNSIVNIEINFNPLLYLFFAIFITFILLDFFSMINFYDKK
ncbi:hypothetical protein FFONT_0894 [Fervidicoccus fontis Kam940]|uniref:Uncharacterized protein n=1 Tax=Fervidicoccus fontis (strain DSM 19380 / JCM 18336 / VKM B-2539 / Kam940) TaxID=1163730 RepID=I0A1M5_FERFK|nr:hypothetical protein FFONT_0894 [Fervidicoccus fontis Kam940]PMB76774.1 MAG: hypothetical protein C0177_05140 [Fervidicoccus fontis]